MNTMNQPTPETDAAEKLFGELPGLCHRLERERDDEKLAHEFTATAYKLMREERDQLREQLRLAYEDAERWRFFATSKQTILMLGGDIRPDSIMSESAVKTTCDALADAHRERMKGATNEPTK